jgi:hypothetical protein
MNEKKKEKLRGDLLAFMRQYRRRKHRNFDPNDRHYDRELEEKLKKMKPEELDELLND